MNADQALRQDPAGALTALKASADLRTLDGAWRDLPPNRRAFVAVVPEGARLRPGLAAAIAAAAALRPDVDVFYGDEVAFEGRRWTPFLKPAFNAALLLSQDYTGSALLISTNALHRLGGVRSDRGTAALYDLVLRAHACGMTIDTLRDVVLAHDGARPTPSATDRRQALSAHLQEVQPTAFIRAGLTATSSLVSRRFDPHPHVTLVVPTRGATAAGGRPYIEALLETLLRTSWPLNRLQVLVGDDRDGPPPASPGALNVKWVHTPRPEGAAFNYAAKMNRLWRLAQSENVVFLNDDVEVINGGWLEALLSLSVSEDVGGVGARLLYPNGTVQHAGMVGGLLGGFSHPWIGQDAMLPTYGDWALVQRDWSAVTGAVFATRRAALEAVNGFDEQFALEYNDIDLCLRLQMLGMRIVYAPDAELIHHEKASRGASAQPGSQTSAFLRRWRTVVANDPAYHPQLSRNGLAVRPAPDLQAWWQKSEGGGSP